MQEKLSGPHCRGNTAEFLSANMQVLSGSTLCMYILLKELRGASLKEIIAFFPLEWAPRGRKMFTVIREYILHLHGEEESGLMGVVPKHLLLNVTESPSSAP